MVLIHITPPPPEKEGRALSSPVAFHRYKPLGIWRKHVVCKYNIVKAKIKELQSYNNTAIYHMTTNVFIQISQYTNI